MPKRQADAGLSLAFQELSHEDIDEAFSEIDELRQRWDDRLSIKNLALAERYLKGELEFGIILEWQSDARVSEKYVAILERKFPFCGHDPHHRAFSG